MVRFATMPRFFPSPTFQQSEINASVAAAMPFRGRHDVKTSKAYPFGAERFEWSDATLPVHRYSYARIHVIGKSVPASFENVKVGS